MTILWANRIRQEQNPFGTQKWQNNWKYGRWKCLPDMSCPKSEKQMGKINSIINLAGGKGTLVNSGQGSLFFLLPKVNICF